MAVETDADRLDFFSTDDFALAATIGGSTVYGIFDNEYLAFEVEGVAVASNNPTFLCRASDLPAITYGTTTATINAIAYVIVEEKPDGTGITLLELREPT